MALISCTRSKDILSQPAQQTPRHWLLNVNPPLKGLVPCGSLNEKCTSKAHVFEHLVLSWQLFGKVIES